MSLFNHRVSIHHFEPKTYIKGVVQAPKYTTTTTTMASVQPVSGKILEQFPEGERDHIRFTVFLSTPITLSHDDKVVYNGVTYKVFRRAEWGDAPFLQHTEIYIGDFNE